MDAILSLEARYFIGGWILFFHWRMAQWVLFFHWRMGISLGRYLLSLEDGYFIG